MTQKDTQAQQRTHGLPETEPARAQKPQNVGERKEDHLEQGCSESWVWAGRAGVVGTETGAEAGITGKDRHTEQGSARAGFSKNKQKEKTSPSCRQSRMSKSGETGEWREGTGREGRGGSRGGPRGLGAEAGACSFRPGQDPVMACPMLAAQPALATPALAW